MKIPKIYTGTRALIFDLDGTLAHTMPMHFQAWQMAANSKGFHITQELFLSCAGLPTVKIVSVLNEEYDLKLDPVEFSSIKEEFFQKEIHNIQGISPVIELVHQYHGKLPMSIGTGGKKEIAQKTMEVLGLDKYFSILVSSEDVLHHKPAPDTFLKCAELMGVDPKFCQVFEDGERGIEAARNAGMMVTDVRPYYMDEFSR